MASKHYIKSKMDNLVNSNIVEYNKDKDFVKIKQLVAIRKRGLIWDYFTLYYLVVC